VLGFSDVLVIFSYNAQPSLDSAIGGPTYDVAEYEDQEEIV
jgi:hypothetical protein